MKIDNNYPANFNLFLASHAVKGILEAIYELTAEIPDKEPELSHWANSLTGLAWTGRNTARELDDFLGQASDRHRFPKAFTEIDTEYEPGGVREMPALYVVNS